MCVARLNLTLTPLVQLFAKKVYSSLHPSQSHFLVLKSIRKVTTTQTIKNVYAVGIAHALYLYLLMRVSGARLYRTVFGLVQRTYWLDCWQYPVSHLLRGLGTLHRESTDSPTYYSVWKWSNKQVWHVKMAGEFPESSDFKMSTRAVCPIWVQPLSHRSHGGDTMSCFS